MMATATVTLVQDNAVALQPNLASNVSRDNDSIDAQLTYIVRDERHRTEKPYTLNYDTQGILPASNIRNEAHAAVIRDFRPLQTDRSFEECGFTSSKFACELKNKDFDDKVLVEREFYPAVMKALGSMFPDASEVLILEHALRKRHPAFPIATGTSYEFFQPATLTHTDFTVNSAARTAQAAFQRTPESYKRLVTVNFWKQISDPGNDWPLTLCDSRTVDRSQDVTIMADVVYTDRYTENERLYYQDGYEWYWFKDLRDDEFIIFRQSDSNIDGGGGVLHASFRNPHTPEATPPRESIEVRAFIFWNR